ncbi:MAG: DUF6512 family protein [Oscillospiraceae bacterium]|nr:DUF6512 family protein [Oscillospiraceae bacterium]
MKILLYHEKLTPQSITERAAQRSHMLHKTIFWDLALLTVLLLSGTLLYYYVPYLTKIPILRSFLPVRGSVWELLKLLFFPTAVIALLRYLLTGKLQKGILTTYATGIALCELLMIVLLYTVSGILGMQHFWIDSSVICFCGLCLSLYMMRSANRQKCSNLPGAMALGFMTAGFLWFTEVPPQIGLFL